MAFEVMDLEDENFTQLLKDLMDQIIEKGLTAHGVSDRLNDRDDLFHGGFSYRSDYFRKAYEKDPYNIQCKNDFEWMQEALDLFEQQFYERNFWYCEYDYIAVARK